MSDASLTPPVSASDHSQGPADAPITLVEYGDFQCPYCADAFGIVQSIQQRLGNKLRFVFRQFPLTQAHPHAEHAAEASEAAAASGKFWDMHDLLYQHHRALGDAALTSYASDIGLDPDAFARALESGAYTEVVREQFVSGVRSGVNGTPAFFINGERYDGTWNDEDEFVRALRAAAD